MMELIRGFIHTADQFAPEDMQSKEFAAMMDLIRQNFAYFTDSASYEDTTKFLDVFSVDYPEAWAKIEQGTLKKKNTLPPQTLAAIIRHFSNQGEGTDRFYDQMETAIQNHFSSMSLKEVIVVGCY